MGNKVSWNQEKNCVSSMNAESSSCPTIISSLSKFVPMIPRYGHQMCSVLLVGDVAWKTGRNHWGLSFFRARRGMSITDYRSRSINRGSGHRSCTVCTVNPQNLFCFVLSAVLHFTSFTSFPFFSFFFLLCSSVACTNTEECWTTWLQVPLASSTVVARFRSRRSCRDLLTLNVFAANFRVVLVVVTFFLFLFLCGEFEHFFFWEEIVSESTLIETSFARQPHGASISSLPSSPRAPAQESWIFRCPQCSSPSKMGSTAPRPAWCPW